MSDRTFEMIWRVGKEEAGLVIVGPPRIRVPEESRLYFAVVLDWCVTVVYRITECHREAVAFC